MRTILFRDKKYDSEMLARLAGLGYKLKVSTGNIDISNADKALEPKVAIEIAGRFYLLTGQIDPAFPEQTLSVLSKVGLKKALVSNAPVAVPERRASPRAQWSNPPRYIRKDEYDYSYD